MGDKGSKRLLSSSGKTSEERGRRFPVIQEWSRGVCNKFRLFILHCTGGFRSDDPRIRYRVHAKPSLRPVRTGRILLSVLFRLPSTDMLSDESLQTLERHVNACDEARDELQDALDAAESVGRDAPAEKKTEALEPVADALRKWQSAQQAFMDAVEESEAPDVPMASLFLKNDADVDATNARRGLPGAHVEGTDQPFDLDLTGTRGTILTNAIMEV